MSAVTSNADWAETDDDIYVTVVGAAGTTRAVGTNDLTKDDTQRVNYRKYRYIYIANL